MQDNNPSELDQIRHSAAHLLAAAVLELFPGTKNTIGPSIENGFYYDFDFGDKSISEEDLAKIEAKMAEIVESWEGFERIEVSADEARERFKDNPYKLELIEEFSKDGQTLTLYKSGPPAGGFVDLCRGGHIDNPKQYLRAFKLLSIAGAYWRGDENNKMLTRIYGTAFPRKIDLDEYLFQLEEAKKRDHRKLGQELELFTIEEEIGPGLILWLPKGTIIKDELENFAKETEKRLGYQRISTPLIAKDVLFVKSGHLPYYKDDMFSPMKTENSEYYLKPMNCPFMHLAYRVKKRSYRDLPIRYAEFGYVHRFEDSGTLIGLMRVRGITQNDAHIYCSEENIKEEIKNVMELHKYYYDLFGITNYYIELALPDLENKKDKYFDDREGWERSVSILRESAKDLNIEVVEKVGEAAFYGPKFDFNIKSVIGRVFGASTNQLDFGSGKRFNLTYTDKDGSEKIVPYVLHRAPLGSTERFIGFLIEHFGGAFPTWLSPVQVMIVPISEKNNEYGKKLLEQLKDSDVRAEIDERSETMQSKIRDAQLQKIPYMLVIGDKEEAEGDKVAVRNRKGENLGVLTISEFLEKIKSEIESKAVV